MERWIGQDQKDLEVFVRYKGMEIRMSGSPDQILRSFLDFFNKVLPAYALASNLTLTVDFEQLLKDLEGVLAITSEGLIVTVPKEEIAERDALILHLVKAHVGYRLGKIERDMISISELLTLTSGKPSSTAARMSELVDLNWVERVGRGEYRITTYGVKIFQESTLPKIVAKRRAKNE